jgi:hypothetical protein
VSEAELDAISEEQALIALDEKAAVTALRKQRADGLVPLSMEQVERIDKADAKERQILALAETLARSWGDAQRIEEGWPPRRRMDPFGRFG